MKSLMSVFTSKKAASSSSLIPKKTQTLMEQARGPRGESGGEPEKVFAEGEKPEEKLVGVVVTIYEGSSYDPMFREVQPVTVPGERISTYSLGCGAVGDLHRFLSEEGPVEMEDSWRTLVEEIRAVEADSVVFNWECCSGCGDHAFPACGGCRRSSFRSRRRQQCDDEGPEDAGGPSATMRMMGFAVRSGHTVMCSDFSLMSLIHEWAEAELGPNPFLKVGTCSDQFALEFEPAELQNEEVPQQLQVVGELCASQGKAVVHAMGGTIVYTLNPRRRPTDVYDLKVLTVVSEHSNFDHRARLQDDMLCSVGGGAGQKRGTAGHVSLTFKQGGGQLITSNGHWIELTKIDATLDSVQRVAEKNFGRDEVDSFMCELGGARTEAERAECVQKRAQKMIHQSVASRMKCRTKFG